MKILFDLDGPILDVSERYYLVSLSRFTMKKKELEDVLIASRLKIILLIKLKFFLSIEALKTVHIEMASKYKFVKIVSNPKRLADFGAKVAAKEATGDLFVAFLLIMN